MTTDKRQLTRYPLLRILPPEQLDAWLAAGQDVDSPSGVTIFQENTDGAWVYLIQEGRVRILRQSGDREVTLGILQAGDLFGEYALLPPGRNTATCRTAAASRLRRLPLAPLRTVLQGVKPVWRNLKNWLRLHTLLHFQRGRAFLGFMSAESGLRLLDRLRPAIFPVGQTIQAIGLAADYWHIIEEGTVRLTWGDRADAVWEDLGPGDTIGEGGLVGANNMPEAVALTDVRCQVLTRHDIDPHAPAQSLFGQSYEPRHRPRPETHVWVPQREETDCGLASLAMVCLRLGAKVSVEELRHQAAPGPQGLSLQQLRQVAMDRGLACSCVRVSVERLRQVTFPAIAHLRNGHYVVLHELGAGGVIVGDPAMGIVAWTGDFLAQHFSGVLLLFNQADSDKQQAPEPY